ncbi:hypothetical protein GGP41_004203 [Bipolaris sorokiniana]|uniref:Uncharacterized protein n=1 Tax=Cochliobolus sativus TaxID=45130 RepID=A0A8H6DYN4_COCSA|nr:hypothetical protein GGP41_004203 [Bipolaris sorokiniana]
MDSHSMYLPCMHAGPPEPECGGERLFTEPIVGALSWVRFITPDCSHVGTFEYRRAYPVTGSFQVKHDRSPLYLTPGQPGDTSTLSLLPTVVSAISAQPTGPSSDCLSAARTGAQSSLAGWPESWHLQIRSFRSIDLLHTVVAPAYSTTQTHSNTDSDSEQKVHVHTHAGCESDHQG